MQNVVEQYSRIHLRIKPNDMMWAYHGNTQLPIWAALCRLFPYVGQHYIKVYSTFATIQGRIFRYSEKAAKLFLERQLPHHEHIVLFREQDAKEEEWRTTLDAYLVRDRLTQRSCSSEKLEDDSRQSKDDPSWGQPEQF